MNVVILCAGFATRMYPLTENFPKPLLEVAGKPVLDYLIEQVVVLPAIESIHIVSNAKFYDHFLSWCHKGRETGQFAGIPVHIHNDGCLDNENRLGAAADLLLGIQKTAKPGKLLVTGGDNIFRFSLKPLWEAFSVSDHHLILSLAEKNLQKLQKTGVLEIADDGRVVRLHEKPDQPPSTWISPPLYFFQPSVRSTLKNFLKTPGNHDAPGYFIDYLCQQETVHAFQLNSKRFDIGNMESYHEADKLLRCSLKHNQSGISSD